MASTESSDDKATPPNQWGWSNMWKGAKTAAEELSKKMVDNTPQWQETAGSVMQNWGFTTQQGSSQQNSSSRFSLFGAKLAYTYITPRIVAMPFPQDPASKRRVDGSNPIHAIAEYLNEKHRGHYMIWNVSEESYDYSLFNDQVLEYKFPGHPAPPLGLLFKICTSIESWLDADEQNVAVVHCLTGKGRTASILACLLTWSGKFGSAVEALQYIAQTKQVPINALTIPSQRRYIQYFANMMDGVKPSPQPMLLRRIIIGPVPKFGAKGGGGGALRGEGQNGADDIGCRPYIQLFKGGKLITTVPWQGLKNSSEQSEQTRAEVAWASHTSDQIAFHVDSIVHGDILLRCRHLDTSGRRISMFRIAFHTGYVPRGVYRLSKDQLDGACADPRFDDDFFIDLIFAPVEKSDEVPDGSAEGSSAEAEEQPTSRSPYTQKTTDATDSGVTVDPVAHNAFDALLHRNNRFWEAVAAKKARNRSKKPEARGNQTGGENFSIADGIDNEEEISFRNVASRTGEEGGDIGLSSDELLKQLTLAEQEMDEGIASRYGNPTDEVDLRIADEGGNVPSTSSSSAKEGKSGQATEKEISAQSELTALEDLEKELGLAGLDSQGSTASKPADSAVGTEAAAAPTTALDDDDNLEELEKYLESLQSS